VHAIGPGLTAFNTPGAMPDPHFALFNATQAKIAESDNSDGNEQLTIISVGVAAFGISGRSSNDARLLVTLWPGNYAAQVRGASAGGCVLLEVYEVP
jgi:hypothetical protein